MIRSLLALTIGVCLLQCAAGCGSSSSSGGSTTDAPYVLSGSVAIGPVTFESGEIAHPAAAALTDGRVFFAYRDVDASNGKYVIYDETGTASTAADPNQPAFSTSPFHVSASVLSNGNVVLAYQQGAPGVLEVLGADGSQVVGETTFESGATQYSSVVQALDGTIFVFYKDFNDGGQGKFVRYQADGTRLSAANPGQPVFETGEVLYIRAVALLNGNVLVVYRDDDDSGRGKFAIYDSAGSLVSAANPNQPVFHNGSTRGISASVSADGHFLIAYRDSDDSNSGKAVVYSSAGVRTSAQNPDDPVFETSVEESSVVGLEDNRFLIAYTASGGHFVILDISGNVTQGPTSFCVSADDTPSACLLSSGKVAVAYSLGTGSAEGRFVIIE